ncbi:hypothetical protein ACFO5X_04625 [Seohaeicola nanhaiensis]|uniref:DUF3239 domain-containing protein n=1 Tax=Seohaeicola nanhaiensis TaxID=1387282 RepID=A0ABV9KD02_9RHOB
MTFIRPEVRTTLWRWREVIAGAAVALLGLSWAAGPGGLLGWIGWVLVVGGFAMGVVGAQRARFRLEGEGPGVVSVDEGQISYFGPLTGGVVAAREMERLTLDPTQHPAHWVLSQPGMPPLAIPVTAQGAEGLFDIFATLPGMRTEHMLAQLRGGAVHPVVIWEKAPTRPPHLRLN